MSPVVGTLLITAITFSMFGIALAMVTDPFTKESCESHGATHDYFDTTNCQKYSNKEKAHSSDNTSNHQSPPRPGCNPVSVMDTVVAWKCDLKPKLGGY